MITRILVVFALLATSAAANADFIGLYAGAGYWRQTITGHAISNVDVESELGIGKSSGNYLYVALEHPIPIIPNIRVARTSIDESGEGTLTTSFTYQGQSFTSGQQVNSVINLTNTDLTLYYEIIDTGVEFDLGLTGRFVKGEVTVDTATQGVKVGFPMVYGHARIPLPLTHTYVDGNVNYVSWQGNQISDIALGVGWQTQGLLLPELGVELGWRRFAIDVSQSDADVAVDAAVKGVFLNVTGHF